MLRVAIEFHDSTIDNNLEAIAYNFGFKISEPSLDDCNLVLKCQPRCNCNAVTVQLYQGRAMLTVHCLLLANEVYEESDIESENPCSHNPILSATAIRQSDRSLRTQDFEPSKN